MVNILLYVPIWGRPALTRLHFQNVKRIVEYKPDVYKITPHFVISEQWAKELCDEFGYQYVFSENKPLGQKLNAGLKPIIKEPFDFLMNLGSDDFINPEFLDEYHDYFYKFDAFGITKIHVISSQLGTQKRCVIGYPYGALRCIKWQFVYEASIWRGGYIGMWQKKKSQGLDFSSMENLKNRTGIDITPVQISEILWDVKDGNNINSFGKVYGVIVDVPVKKLPVEIRCLTYAL